MAQITSLPGSVNGGSKFSILVGNRFVETPQLVVWALRNRLVRDCLVLGVPLQVSTRHAL